MKESALLKLLIVGGLCFFIGLADSISVDAGSFEDLSLIGKIASLEVTITVLLLTVVYWVIPMGSWVWQWLKKNW